MQKSTDYQARLVNLSETFFKCSRLAELFHRKQTPHRPLLQQHSRQTASVVARRFRSGLAATLAGVFLLAGLAQAQDLSLGPFAQGVYSGSAPFNTTGTCSDPGDDCSDSDDRVRAADLIQFAWSVSASNIAPDEPDIAAVVLEQTITPGATADVVFEEIPVICLPPPLGTGGLNPASEIINNADGSATLRCNLGSFGNGVQKSFSVPVRPLATSSNGATFTTTQKVFGFDAGGNQIVTDTPYNDPATYEISAAPAFDLDATRRAIYKSYVATIDVGNGPEKGFVSYFTAHIAADADRAGKGIEALSNDFTFTPGISATESDGVTSYPLNYKIIECTPNTSGWGNTVYGSETVQASRPIERKVVDSGSCAIKGDALSGYTLRVTDADTTGSRYPSETANGSSLAAGPYFVAAYRLRVFVPFSEIDREDGNPTNNAGAIQLKTCLSDFDPVSHTGVSNYGTGTEPGYNGTVMPDGSASNNCSGPITLQVSVGGSFNHRVYQTATDTAGQYGNMVSAYHSGDSLREPGQTFVTFTRTSNNGSVDFENGNLCGVFDRSVLKLTDAGNTGASSGKYAYLSHNFATRANWKIEYGSWTPTADDPLDGNNDGTLDLDPTTGRYLGDWTEHQSMRCDDPSITDWNTDPAVVGLDNINIVRAVPIDPVSDLVFSGNNIDLFMPFEVRQKTRARTETASPQPLLRLTSPSQR